MPGISAVVASEGAPPVAASVESSMPEASDAAPDPVADADGERSGSGGTGGATGSGDGGGGAGDGRGVAAAAAPPTRACADPITGVWQALMRMRSRGGWDRITLFIERDGDALRGSISNHRWEGGDDMRHPPSCAEGTRQRTVRMTASGDLHGDRFSFAGHDYEVLPGGCLPLGLYNVDWFHGTLVAEEQTLYALWDDNGVMQRQPVHFRRTACTIPGVPAGPR